MRGKKGFTLIELLIVVAIIGILAAIAIPNFLQAQTRAKVSRAFSEMQMLATALESYYVDNNIYPEENKACGLVLTTPITYVSSIPEDPFNQNEYRTFADGAIEPPNTTSPRYYGYYTATLNTATGSGIKDWASGDIPAQFWLLVSNGPDNNEEFQSYCEYRAETDGVTTYDGQAFGAGQYGGKDGIDKDGTTWYDPDMGITSNGDLGRAGP